MLKQEITFGACCITNVMCPQVTYMWGSLAVRGILFSPLMEKNGLSEEQDIHLWCSYYHLTSRSEGKIIYALDPGHPVYAF